MIGDVELAQDVSVWFQVVLRGDINAIVIGDRTNIQDGCIMHVTHECSVRVGSDVTIGHGAVIHGCAIGDASLANLPAESGLSRFLLGKALLHGRGLHHRVRVHSLEGVVGLVADGVGQAPPAAVHGG